MAKIPKSFLQELTEKNDIVSVVSARIALKKRGHNFIACCPFHDEKTPSFNVSEDKQFYYCFGCGASGDVISFVMQYDRLEFLDAVEYLASQAGLTVPKDSALQNQEDHRALYAVLEEAAQLYFSQLKDSPDAIIYLKNRGITGDIAHRFQIGFAPDAWDALLKHFPHSQHTNLQKAGLTTTKTNKTYDRFRKRIMFPIRNIRGKTIGFGGRVIDNEHQPKYLNSPETDVFHKNREVYGLYEAKQYGSLESVLIVEGYLDVISLHQHGITNVVATLGTAMNAFHVKKLTRYTSTCIFCFDGDNAGRNAAWKAALLSLPVMRDGLELCFLFLPQGEDPDSLVQRIGADAFKNLITEATALADFFFTQLQKEIPLDSIAQKAQFSKVAMEHISTMPKGMYKHLMQQRCASLINTDVATFDDIAAADDMEPVHQPMAPPPRTASRRRIMLSSVDMLISLLIAKPTLIELLPETISAYAIPDEHMPILCYVSETLRKNPSMPIADLINNAPEAIPRQTLSKLALRPQAMPENDYQQVFVDAHKSLLQQHQARIVNRLINKGKTTGLSEEEKQQLQALIRAEQL